MERGNDALGGLLASKCDFEEMINDLPAAVKKSFDAMPVGCGLKLRKNDRLV